MNCEEYKKLIYLFTELTPFEKRKVEDHITICSACNTLFQQVQREGDMLRSLLTSQRVPSESSLLTGRIMSAISERAAHKSSIAEKFFDVLEFQPLKYALAVMSIIIVGFFVSETYVAGKNTAGIYKRYPARPKTVQLNSAKFYQQVKETFESGQSSLSLRDCIATCETPEEQKCSDCKTKYPIIKLYEGI
jgi:hypothetical protein